jgi:glycyl-tRNA synthetase alpha subunit
VTFNVGNADMEIGENSLMKAEMVEEEEVVEEVEAVVVMVVIAEVEAIMKFAEIFNVVSVNMVIGVTDRMIMVEVMK